jgi:hypothetical protein
MKHLKTLGVFAMAAMALLVVASSASATVLYSSGAVYTGPITATLESGTSALLTTTGGTTLDTCTFAAVGGNVEEDGATKTAAGNINELIWGTQTTPCSEPTTTTSLGRLEIHWISGTTNGTVTAVKAKETPTEVTVNTTIFGANCVYTTGEALDLGTLIGSTSSNATIAINTVVKSTNEFICPDSRWQASYKVTTPGNLYVEEK